MDLRTLPLLLALGATPALAADDDATPGEDAAPEASRVKYDWSARAAGGWFHGLGVRTDSGGLALIGLDLTPKLRGTEWSVALPLRLDHRQTFGASLSETTAEAGLDAMRAKGDVRSGWLASAAYTLRPDWPDLYQPDGAGGYRATNRYSYFQALAGWQYWNRLGDGQNLRAKLRYVHSLYPRDAHYNEAESVVHLAPRDNGQLKLDTSWRTVRRRFAFAVKADGWFRQDFVLLAKNAGSGGTSRSNPKQRLAGVDPAAELELRTKPLDLTLGYSFLARADLFEGYYSYTGHRPYAQVKVALGRDLEASVAAEARFITFGPDSKTDTEDGKRLRDAKYKVKGGLRYALAGGLALVADAEWTRRDTNFPDYVPGVYPATTADYDIDWDYTNVLVTGGVEWRP